MTLTGARRVVNIHYRNNIDLIFDDPSLFGQNARPII